MQYGVYIIFERNNLEKLSDSLILQWNVESGADEIISETPGNLYTVTKLQSPVCAAPSPAVTIEQTAATNSETSCNPQTNICLDNISTLDELRQTMKSFTGCPLKTTAMNLVFSDGCPQAKLMIIGEAPGADEDRMGKAFVGRSGQLLDKMLASVGLSREKNVYISNIIPWRPPGNRTPSTAEVTTCLPFIKKHIELINPKMILLLGKSSSSALLDTTDNISRLRGKLFEYKMADGHKIPALVTFHPAFLLREPLQKRLAWQDMLKLQKTLTDL